MTAFSLSKSYKKCSYFQDIVILIYLYINICIFYFQVPGKHIMCSTRHISIQRRLAICSSTYSGKLFHLLKYFIYQIYELETSAITVHILFICYSFCQILFLKNRFRKANFVAISKDVMNSDLLNSEYLAKFYAKYKYFLMYIFVIYFSFSN